MRALCDDRNNEHTYRGVIRIFFNWFAKITWVILDENRWVEHPNTMPMPLVAIFKQIEKISMQEYVNFEVIHQQIYALE